MDKTPLFIPADLPKVDFGEQVSKLFKREFFYEKMNSEKLTREEGSTYKPTIWNEDKRASYGPIMDWVERHVPVQKLINVKIVSPSDKIIEHVDFSSPNLDIELYKHSLSLEPCGYRILLKGDRYSNLFIRNRNLEKVFVKIPEQTDTYLISHTQTIHGLDRSNDDRFAVFIQGWMDTLKHREILRRSLEKYEKYAVY